MGLYDGILISFYSGTDYITHILYSGNILKMSRHDFWSLLLAE